MAEVQELKATKGNRPFADVAKKMQERVANEKAAETPASENKPVFEDKKPEVKVETKAAEKPVEVKTEIKVEDKKADSKVEDTKTEAEEKESAKPKDTKKQWWEDSESPATIVEDKKDGNKSEVDYAAKLKEYEDILADQEVQALLSAKKAGKNLLSFAEELKGTDASKLTPSDLYKMRLVSAGASEEEITEALSEFSNKPKWQQNEETQSIRAKLESERQENLKRVIGSNSDYAEKQKQNVNKAIAELDAFVSDLNDKELFGVKITPEIAKGLKDTVMNEISYTNPDGTTNIQLSIEQALWHKYKKIVMKANIAKAKAESTEQVLNEMTRANVNNTSDKRLPVDSKDDMKDAKDSYLSRKQQHFGIRK